MALDAQNAKSLAITEGDVKTIHDSDNRLLWGKVMYNTKYNGDIFQLSYTGDNFFTDSSDVIDSAHCTYNYDDGVYTITNTDQSDPSLTLGIYLPAGYYTINSDSYLSANTQFVNGDTVVTSISSNYSNYTFKIDEACTGIKFNWSSTSDHIVLGLNTLQIISTAPSPSTPQPISVVKGHQIAAIAGGTTSQNYSLDLTSKNLFNPNASTIQQSSGSSAAPITNGVRVSYSGSSTTGARYVTYLLGDISSYVGKNIIAQATMVASGSNTTRLSIGLCSSDGSNRVTKAMINDTGSIYYQILASDVETRPYLYVYLYVNNSDTSGTVKSGDYADYTNIQVEISDSTTPTTYAPYFTPIELCKIDTYQDYIWKDGSDWKVHKEVGKVVLDGTETWNYNNTTQVFFANNIADYLGTGFVPVSNYYTGKNISGYVQLHNMQIGFLAGSYSRIVIKNLDYADVTNFKSWLSSHNTTAYYVLATPTDTTITDTTLISQLESVKEWCDRAGYESTVTSVSPNLPIVIDRVAL